MLFLWWSFYRRRKCLYRGRAIKYFNLSSLDEKTNYCVNAHPTHACNQLTTRTSYCLLVNQSVS